MSRLILYVIFSLVTLGLLNQVGVPDVIAGAYILVAVVGFAMAVRDLRARARDDFAREMTFKSMARLSGEGSRNGTPQHWPGLKGEWAEAADRIVARAEEDAQEALRVRAEPWYADAVVDLNEVASRWFVEGHALADTVLIVPNPYFVLSLEALVKWGFATAVEVREATRWATSDRPPVRWHNPLFRERLNFIGWSDAEAYARVGLFHWRTDPLTPDPAAATIEAKLRASGETYDVPRPASLA